jgi:hypothetical protein
MSFEEPAKAFGFSEEQPFSKRSMPSRFQSTQIEFGRWREEYRGHFEEARCEGESAPGFFCFCSAYGLSLVSSCLNTVFQARLLQFGLTQLSNCHNSKPVCFFLEGGRISP